MLVEKNYKRGHARRGKKNTSAHNAKIGAANTGRIRSPEAIEKCLQTKREKYGGFSLKEETKQKISETLRGKKKPWLKGSKRSEDTRAKISNTLKGHFTSEETRKKISSANSGSGNGMYGKHLKDFMTDEAYDQWRKNLSKAMKKRWKNYTPEKKDKICERLKENRKRQVLPVKDSSIEIKVQSFLQQLAILHETHKYIEIEHGYQCDIYCSEMNLIIECDGDYWHNYPDYREIDLIRTEEIIQQGYKILRLWECEIKDMTVEQFDIRVRETYEK